MLQPHTSKPHSCTANELPKLRLSPQVVRAIERETTEKPFRDSAREFLMGPKV